MEEDQMKILKNDSVSMKQMAFRAQNLLTFWNTEYKIDIPMVNDTLATKISQEEYAKRIFMTTDANAYEMIARDFAAFEKDFAFIKYLNYEMSLSHQQILNNLPTVEEMDCLIEVVNSKDEKDEMFFKSQKKNERLKVMQLLKTAALKLKGA